MREVALVFDQIGNVLYLHIPEFASSASIPDSKTLWDQIWEFRAKIGGVAHTHPWKGEAHASHEDLTTFAGVEAGIGKRLIWPVVSLSEVRVYSWNWKDAKYEGEVVKCFEMVPWIERIRQLSTIHRGESK